MDKRDANALRTRILAFGEPARYLQACRATHQSHFQFTYQELTYLPAQLSNLFTKLTYLFASVQGRLLTEARVLAQ